MRHFKPRRSRGAATVEMALSLLLIVPLFLYTVFMGDLLNYGMDQQEAVDSSPWDATLVIQTHNYKSIETAIQHNDEKMFCDHESGIEITNAVDCSGTAHHLGHFASHQCWLNKYAQQIACVRDASVGQFKDPSFKQYASNHNGGMITCSGREVVENYLIPKTFLQSFSKVDMAKKTWQGSNAQIHTNSQAGDMTTAYYFAMDHLSVLVDSYALNVPQDVRPGQKSGSGDKQRIVADVKKVYMLAGATSGYLMAGLQFMMQLPSLVLPIGDDPLTPNVSMTPKFAPAESIKQESGSSKYFSSPWMTKYQQSYNKRGKYYMGCKNAQSC